MRHRSLGAFVVALLAVALGLGASVATGSEPAPDGFAGVFELNGTHGFKVAGLIGSNGRKTELTLFVDRRNEGATYAVFGKREGEQFDFDLGPLGKVEVEAQPTGRMETVRTGCGKPIRLEGSNFVGTIEFHGEEGFTEAEAVKTPLRYGLLLSIGCGVSSQLEAFSVDEPGARLKVTRKDGPRLHLNQNRPGGPVFYEAQISERRHQVSIHRTVGGHLGGGAFSFDPSLTDASFAAGAPFSGSATYLGAHPPRGTHPADGTWRGNLTVDFPGHADVPLAGPGFKAAIIHARRTESGR